MSSPKKERQIITYLTFTEVWKVLPGVYRVTLPDGMGGKKSVQM